MARIVGYAVSVSRRNTRYGSISDARPGLGKHPAHRLVVHAQLGRDGADRPLLGVMQALDLGFECARDGHERNCPAS